MATEKRLIDANEALRMMRNSQHDTPCTDKTGKGVWDIAHNCAISCVNACPTVDAVEVVHGRWEQVQRWATKAKYRCSVCGREIMSATTVNIAKYPYCHCGAKMDGGN